MEAKEIIAKEIDMLFPDLVIKDERTWAMLEATFTVGEQQGIEKGKRIAVEFIESYLVTTVHPEGDMHHIDDKEWQLVKLKLRRQAFRWEIPSKT